ncbi:bifunctional sugar-1-phosphate nucleotidylyltransferase/acetyltransferase [Archaeoglobus sp.]
MQAVILAAGEGTRMRPLTYTRPKVMLPVANKPIIEHLIVELKKAGIQDVILVVGYRSETIRDYFGKGESWGVRIRYVEQRRQLGTADALKSASHLLDSDFLMLNGDNIVGAEDIARIASRDRALGIYRVSRPQDFGVVIVEDGKVRRIIEKPSQPPANTINAGVYKLDATILDCLEKTEISERGEYEVTDTIQLAIGNGLEFEAVELNRWIDVGYPWDLLRANEVLLDEIRPEIRGEVEDGAVIKGRVFVDEGSLVMSGSYIIGPAIIGKNCRIGPYCYIRPHTSIGDNCHIGTFVEVKNSIIMSNTNLPHLNYAGDSVIGEGCNFGAGTKVANLRLDEKEVRVAVKGRVVSTGRKKFGAVVGDNVKTGINVSINVGAMVGNDVLVGPGKVVSGTVDPGSFLR